MKAAPANAPPHRLPAQLTSFVGRERELREVGRLLQRARLLSLTGVGGCGKTRLALELAAHALPRFGGAAFFVDLSRLADERLVPHAVAEALGVPERPDRAMEDGIAARIGDQPLLLVLDNCEHLLRACATLAESLLGACPALHVLATSREALNVTSELSWRVPPLALPEQDTADLRVLRRSDAVRLLVERARLARPRFALTARNASAVLQICRRVDGIPLALELAAVRLRSLTLGDLASRLEDRFRLLAGARTAPSRHQTLRAAIDWSHDLLDDAERRLFRRTAVFGGGFELASAEAVCAFDGILPRDVAAVAARLVEKSMLVVQESEPARYRLLETLREYARERLRESGEAELVGRGHADYFAALALSSDAWGGPGQAVVLARLVREHDNLRAALEWLRARTPEALLATTTALGWFCFLRGYFAEGRRWLEAGLAASDERSPLRVRALHWLGLFARLHGELATAGRLCEEAVALGREIGDAAGVAHALQRRGSIALNAGDFAAAERFYSESQAAYRALGDRWGIAMLDFYRGWRAAFADDLQAARSHFDACLPALREVGDAFHVAQALIHRGSVALDAADLPGAQASAVEGLSLCRELGNRFGFFIALDVLAGVAAARGHPQRALRLAGAAAAARDAIGQVASAPYRARLDRWLAPARAAMSLATSVVAEAQGRGLPIDRAVDYALEGDERELRDAAAAKGRPAGLTRRELEVAALVARGRTNREIADELVLSERTVEGHVERIRGKLDFHTRAQIAAWLAAEAERARAVPHS